MSRADAGPHPPAVTHALDLRRLALPFVASLLFSSVAFPSVVGAQPLEPSRLVVHQRVVGLVSPFGAEHSVHLALRAPLGDPNELLFSGAHAEAGVSSFTTPVDARTGAYLQVSPLAFLVLRAALLGTVMWPIGLDGAGNFAASGYDAALGPEARRAEHALFATGWDLSLSTTLQGAVPLGAGARLVLWSQTTAEHITLGSASHYFHPRVDAILAREDWVLTHHAMLLAEVPIGSGMTLRLGAYDEARSVPRSGDLSHQLGGVAMLALRAAPEVPEVVPFLRLGAFTEGSHAGDVTALAALFVRYDLAALR